MKRIGHIVIIVLLALACAVPAQAETTTSSSQNFTMQAMGFGQVSVLPVSSLGPPQVLNNGPVIRKIADVLAEVYWKTSQEANSIVEYGTTPAMGMESGKYTASAIDHDITINGLQPSTLYYYRVKSANNEGLIGTSSSGTFTTLADKGIVGITISDITYDSALISWQTGNATRSEIQYGTSTAYGQTVTDSSLNFTTKHSVRLKDLKAGTTYHFRITAQTGEELSDTSSDFSFATNPEPQIADLQVVPKNSHEAEVRWTANTPSSGIFTYWQTGKSRTLSLGSSELTASHGLSLTDLLDNTEYSMKLVITDAFGKQAKTETKTFTMPQDKEAPKISDLKVSVSRSGDDVVMTATWKTNKLSMGKGKVAAKASPNKTINTLPEPAAVSDHILVKTGLNPSTLYILTVQSVDVQGNVGEAQISFITPAVQKGIFSLIADSFAQTFGWISRLMGK